MFEAKINTIIEDENGIRYSVNYFDTQGPFTDKNLRTVASYYTRTPIDNGKGDLQKTASNQDIVTDVKAKMKDLNTKNKLKYKDADYIASLSIESTNSTVQ